MKNGDLIKRIHRALCKANKKYYKWTNGWSLADSGVEGFMVSEIANSIMRKPELDSNLVLTLETPLGYIHENQGKSKNSRQKKSTRKQKRVDIALHKENTKVENVTHVIEVKRKWRKKECLQDIDELRSLLQDYSKKSGKGSIIACIFVLWCKQNTIKKHKDKMEEFLNKKRPIIKFKFCVSDNSLCLLME
ncbi:MAG: hypothetical protein LBV04_03050 [Deferribacteraceae bacterium]|jgi:hypothetical protein|nr:hypothetical protein [Deferribacteraceae bacterium]